jgi:hypothetical protein
MSDVLPAVYLARMDVEQADLPFFMNWYEHKHGPDLIGAGFYSAQAYHSVVGEPLVCNVYEIESSEIFYTPAYQSARTPERDPDRPRILEGVSNRSNTVYEQVMTIGVTLPDVSWQVGSRLGRIEAPVITTARFETPEEDDEAVVEWCRRVEFPRLEARSAFRAARLCRQAGRLHPANPSDQPRWMLLVEWQDEGAAESDGALSEVSDRLRGAPFASSGIEYNLATLVTSLRDSGV